MREIYSKIIGIGSYLPNKIMTNEDLTKIVDTSDEWIYTRTGIKKRHIAEENELTSDLCVKAVSNALSDANVKPEEIDLVIVATVTPDLTFPSTANLVQNKLGMINAVSFDVQAACSGFIYALTMADSMIKAGIYKKAVIIGAETLSKITDWTDRNTCVLFGDGAGAVVLSVSDEPGILSHSIKTDANYIEPLKTTGGVSATKTAGSIYMEGKDVFKLAVSKMPEISKEVVAKAGLEMSDIDIFIPHQANIRIIDAAMKSLGIDDEKVVKTIEEHGNISAGCIPLAFDIAYKKGQIKKGDNILMTAMGAGFTWGSVLVKF